MGGVNQQEPGDAYSKLYFFFKFNGSYTNIHLLIKMMSLMKSLQYLLSEVNYFVLNVSFREIVNFYKFLYLDFSIFYLISGTCRWILTKLI